MSALSGRCESLGYTEPTPIQQKAIPQVLSGTDIIACAETGTGKTAAFLLPIIQQLLEKKSSGTTVLVLAPTRELANQTEAACRQLAPKKIRCASIIGGAGYRRQTDALRRGAEIIVATPGRLIDFMERGEIDFSKLETLVLDEADRMLDMGFLPAIKADSQSPADETSNALFLGDDVFGNRKNRAFDDERAENHRGQPTRKADRINPADGLSGRGAIENDAAARFAGTRKV